MSIEIKYSNGSRREVGSEEDARNILRSEYPEAVQFGGLVWENSADSEDDDGAKAVAEILENGERVEVEL